MWTAVDQSNPSSSTVTWQVTHKLTAPVLPVSVVNVVNVFTHPSSSSFIFLPPTRGPGLDGDPAQQHWADQTPLVSRATPTFGPFWLRVRGEAVGSRHWPVGAMWAGAVLPLQEVPPPQHTRWGHESLKWSIGGQRSSLGVCLCAVKREQKGFTGIHTWSHRGAAWIDDLVD